VKSVSVFESEYFFVELVEQKPKTDVYAVWSKHHSTKIGVVKWYAQWRQYCFFPEPKTVWSLSCLNDINKFIGKLMAIRKERVTA
jgi:hypothetical protein